MGKNIWFILLGLLLIICGIILLVTPIATTEALSLLIGWLSVFCGAATIVHAFFTRNVGGFFLWLLVGIAYVIFGWLILTNILAAMLALSIVFAIYLFVIGILKISTAISLKNYANWIWLFLSGFLSVILGILFMYSPLMGALFIGIMIGLDFMIFGLSLILLSSAMAKLA